MSDLHIVVDIFMHMDAPAPKPENETPAKPQRLDPIKELRETSGPIQIDYSVRYQADSTNGFMDFTKADRRWLNALISDLRTVRLADKADRVIMDAVAKARTRHFTGQTWQEFIDGIYADKVKSGYEFTQNQMKNLCKLVGLLSKGKTLAGCGSLVFKENVSGSEIKL